MKVAITGASGLVGTAVSRRLEEAGHQVTRVVRSREAAREPDAVYWKPASGEIDAAGIAGHDAVINLAGENIFGIWTDAKKRRIRESRVKGTTLMAETLAELDPAERPGVLINSSGVHYYGQRPADEPVTEDAPPASGFMADLVQEWEGATRPAADAGVRVVMLRSGVVLDSNALILQGMSVSTRFGLGAKLGEGDQVFPWITRDEIASVMAFVLTHESLQGPVNMAAPDRVTNEEFADTLARVLDRPRALKVPRFALQMLGDLGDVILTGAWVVPKKLEEAGYEWLDPELEPALRRMLS
jgi:uncharacterized protein (TIGR01777 family)